MPLMTEELRADIPALYSQENIDAKEKIVHAKFFFPAGNWTWFVTEGKPNGDDFVFFGYVIGDFDEWGYFTLDELESVNVAELTVERDLYFKPGKFREVLNQFRKERG